MCYNNACKTKKKGVSAVNVKYMRSVAFTLLALVCLVSFFIGALSDCASGEHECHGENCFICLCRSFAEHAVAVIAVFAPLTYLLLFFKNKAYCEAENVFVLATPVRLKVKLSD